MVDRRPVLIAQPAGAADVAAALLFARREGLEVAVRGGGHSPVGTSMSEGGLTIDLSLMRAVRADPQARRARGPGGGRWWGRGGGGGRRAGGVGLGRLLLWLRARCGWPGRPAAPGSRVAACG